MGYDLENERPHEKTRNWAGDVNHFIAPESLRGALRADCQRCRAPNALRTDQYGDVSCLTCGWRGYPLHNSMDPRPKYPVRLTELPH